MQNTIGFIVNSVVEGQSGHFHAIGRCGDEPIRVGDVFEIVRPAVPAGDLDAGELGGARAVHLRVERIQAYQRKLEELGSGMTGTLDLCGQGLELVKSGCVLGLATRPARTMERFAGKSVGSD